MSICECGVEDCTEEAEVYALDPTPEGWGAWYCLAHVPRGFQITDRKEDTDSENT